MTKAEKRDTQEPENHSLYKELKFIIITSVYCCKIVCMVFRHLNA